jgi:hypothetical protein
VKSTLNCPKRRVSNPTCLVVLDLYMAGQYKSERHDGDGVKVVKDGGVKVAEI